MTAVTSTMEFVGVSTGQSSAARLFPRWAAELGIDARLVGRDLPLDAPTGKYRAAVERIRDDPHTRGALVTTHKVALYEAAADLFDDLDDSARLCGEISCVASRGERLSGWAKDPVTAGRTLDALLGPDYFGQGGRSVLCFGGGGSGLAISVHLLTRAHPARLVVTDVDTRRLDALRRTHAAIATGTAVEYVHVEHTSQADRLLGALAPGSLVVNATGMGKDRPGSPISDGATFPQGSVAWDLNYRGELPFLRQARAQQAPRSLTVEDGWEYFVHGWSEHVTEVFGLRWTPDLPARFTAAGKR